MSSSALQGRLRRALKSDYVRSLMLIAASVLWVGISRPIASGNWMGLTVKLVPFGALFLSGAFLGLRGYFRALGAK